jgi:glutamate-1-semialdehyde 2,1-aminomutase
MIERDYAAARPRSRVLYERACRLMPSGAAHDGRVFSPFPFYVERADGARKWDVDGHEYLDAWSGHGALMLGHNHPSIVAAITAQAQRGLHYSACHELELRWAELIQSCVPGAERVRFTMTGTETTALAIRVARAATGRTKIVKFQGHFHGIHDSAVSAVRDPFEVPMTAGVPAEVLRTVLVARPNRLDEVRALLDEHEVAAVILEPAAGRSMVVPTNPGFLGDLRALTRARNVPLIFDEVVTGFRLAPGGAQEYFGVTADLTCLAKAVAGGLLGAALVGRADLMDGIAFSGEAKRDRIQRVADQGTYSGTPLLAAAGVAALEILRTGEVQRHTNRLGDLLREGGGPRLLAARRGTARARHGCRRREASSRHAARGRRLQPGHRERLAQRRDDHGRHRAHGAGLRSRARPARGRRRAHGARVMPSVRGRIHAMAMRRGAPGTGSLRRELRPRRARATPPVVSR